MVQTAGSTTVGKRLLEVFKFGCYVAIPISMMAVFANNSGNLEAIVRNRSYVVYPPEGPRPPTGEEIREIMSRREEAQGKAKASQTK